MDSSLSMYILILLKNLISAKYNNEKLINENHKAKTTTKTRAKYIQNMQLNSNSGYIG